MMVGLGNLGMGDFWSMEIIEILLPDCDGLFLDIGANTGQTLLKVRSCCPERPWIGFEPNPTCVTYLERLIRTNQFKSCVLVPAGLDTESGVKWMDCFTDDPSDQSATLVRGFRPPDGVRRRILVPVVEFCRTGIEDEIGFVKVDVEGGEKEVLQSIQPVLEKSRPIVMLEVLPIWSAENRERLERQKAVEAQFRHLDYAICRIEKSEDDHCRGLRRVLEIGVHDQLSWSDYLAVPSERLDSVLATVGRVG